MSALQEEIDGNLEFFNERLPELLQGDEDRYALLKSRAITGLFDTIRDAKTAGDALYSDGIYSIQKITDVAIDLGAFSHVGRLGMTRLSP